MTARVEHPDLIERTAQGKAARGASPRASHGEWAPADDRADPIALLEQQELTRVPELVPLRHQRMAESAFAFYRGAAVVMSADLTSGPSSGLVVQLCGDAHLANFGFYASPERQLVLDINDFDETLPGPFEWDVKRLVASFEIAARARDFDDKVRSSIVDTVGRAYCDSMRSFATMDNLDIWYSQMTADDIERQWVASVPSSVLKRFQRAVTKAQTKDSMKALGKLTRVEGGEPRFISDPPVLVPVDELFDETHRVRLEGAIRGAFRDYRETLQRDRRLLLERYRYVDLARKVVGVGSVGTRCWVALLVGRDNDDPLFLQIKEAEASVLEPHLGRSEFDHHGQRVVEGQRLMQASSDIFLGWQRVANIDDVSHDYYMRQLWDWKASADLETMLPQGMAIYAQVCGWTLARAHARTGDSVAIAAYLGGGNAFTKALGRFARSYADQNERDHRALVEAIGSGRLASAPAPAPAG
jgi:uncharacterized protein (DUF2252 family)